MEKVIGIGGVFFRADDPLALAHWYRDHLGIDSALDGEIVWKQEAGPTLVGPCSRDTTMFGPNQAVMLNFRVRSVEAMAAQLRNAGIEVRIETHENGCFGSLHDPEGNVIQLWEPRGEF